MKRYNPESKGMYRRKYERGKNVTLQKYADIIKHLDSKNRDRHLLMGNGFSIAYNRKIFSYNALSQLIDDSKNDALKKLFSIVADRNFEQIMSQMSIAQDIIRAFDGEPKLIAEINKAAEALRESLIDAVKTLHPEHVFKIPEENSKSCAEFLKNIVEKGGKIFSTNYDLLLYWVLMRNKITKAIDGFGRNILNQGKWVPPDEVELSELIWGNNKRSQNIFYIHGALQIFDNGICIIKEQYDGDCILENIKQRMNKGLYPVFVTGGNSEEKLSRILHNHYLAYCYDNLCSIGGSLITFGFNFGKYDEHIIAAINKASAQEADAKLWSVYIGVYSEADAKHIESIKDRFKCKVNLFDSKSVNIWNS